MRWREIDDNCKKKDHGPNGATTKKILIIDELGRAHEKNTPWIFI